MTRWSSCLAGLLTLLACLGGAAADSGPAAADGGPTRFLVGYDEASAGQVLARLKALGYVVKVDLKLSGTYAVERAPAPSAPPRDRGVVAAAAAAAEAPPPLPPTEAGIAAQAAGLEGIPGVVAVARDRLIRLFTHEEAAPSSCAADTTRLSDGGNATETTPYGITATQADDPVMLEVASKYASKNILFCVIDSGVDARHPDLAGARLAGCIKGTRGCPHRWDADLSPVGGELYGHGTHVTGTIAAARNGRGVVGAAAGGAAQVFHYNIFGRRAAVWESDSVTAWAQCAAALDALQKTNPAARAVVSMSYGSAGGSDGLPGLGGSASLGGTRTYVTRLYARKDMLFLAAAGNDGDSRTAFPAGYPEVVSVAATGPSGAYAKFSNYNSDVELAAPGSDTLSTLALRDSYGRVGGASLRVSSPLRAPASLIQPPATEFMGSSTGLVTAPLADCGLALSECTGVAGKVCLIERGTNFFCEKVLNCVAGGGLAAVIYNKADIEPCEEALTSGALNGSSWTICPSTTYPPTVGLTRNQGKALLALMAAGTEVNATVSVPLPGANPPYGYRSGTSMATPLAAAVAGLVWAQFPGCSNAQVRAALVAGAKDLLPKGRDVHYGFGIIQARASYEKLAAQPCARAAPRPAPRPQPRKVQPLPPKRRVPKL